MLVDLVQTSTRDGVRLHGMLQTPAGPPAVPVDAFLCIHGTGSNFYGSSLFDALGQSLLGLGCAVLRVNTRGHELMCVAATSRGGVRLGAAYEVLDECRHDLAAWIDWLGQNGRPRVGLIGHSSGAVKCLYTRAHEPNPAVAALVALSPPRLSHSWFAASERSIEFTDTFHHARSLVEAGEPNALLEVQVPLPFVITAAGYVEKYGPDERYNYLGFIDRVGCPTLVTLGALEMAANMAFRGADEAIRQAAPAVAVEVVLGADHFYTGVREQLTERVERWLRGLS